MSSIKHKQLNRLAPCYFTTVRDDSAAAPDCRVLKNRNFAPDNQVQFCRVLKNFCQVLKNRNFCTRQPGEILSGAQKFLSGAQI